MQRHGARSVEQLYRYRGGTHSLCRGDAYSARPSRASTWGRKPSRRDNDEGGLSDPDGEGAYKIEARISRVRRDIRNPVDIAYYGRPSRTASISGLF
jgi:hypothetical protein